MTATFKTTRAPRAASVRPAVVFVVTEDFSCSIQGQMMKFKTGDVVDRDYIMVELQAMRLGDKVRVSAGDEAVVCCPKCRHTFLAE